MYTHVILCKCYYTAALYHTHDHVHMHAHACNLPVCLIYYQLYYSIIHQSPIKVDGIFRLNHWRGWTNKGMGMGGSVQTASDINPRLSCAYAIHHCSSVGPNPQTKQVCHQLQIDAIYHNRHQTHHLGGR